MKTQKTMEKVGKISNRREMPKLGDTYRGKFFDIIRSFFPYYFQANVVLRQGVEL